MGVKDMGAAEGVPAGSADFPGEGEGGTAVSEGVEAGVGEGVGEMPGVAGGVIVPVSAGDIAGGASDSTGVVCA